MNDATEFNHMYFERQAEAMANAKHTKGGTLTEKAFAWIQQEGAVLCEDFTLKCRLSEYVTPVAVLFPDLIAKINAVYVYSMGEQMQEELRKNDGISWKYCDTDTGKSALIIGISAEGLEAGAEYTQFLFMHELAHAATGDGHTTAFHEKLNGMIRTFNGETGSNITNDLYGWPSRHDSMPYNPFAEDIPTIVNKP